MKTLTTMVSKTNKKLDNLSSALTEEIDTILKANQKELSRKLSKVTTKEELAKFFKDEIAPNLSTYEKKKPGESKLTKAKNFIAKVGQDILVGLGTTILGNKLGI